MCEREEESATEWNISLVWRVFGGLTNIQPVQCRVAAKSRTPDNISKPLHTPHRPIIKHQQSNQPARERCPVPETIADPPTSSSSSSSWCSSASPPAAANTLLPPLAPSLTPPHCCYSCLLADSCDVRRSAGPGLDLERVCILSDPNATSSSSLANTTTSTSQP